MKFIYIKVFSKQYRHKEQKFAEKCSVTKIAKKATNSVN
jgi:hypothetical protein